MSSLHPEVELLLCCVRTRVDEARATRIRALVQEALDWDALLQRAREHGVTPLLYHQLHTVCPDTVPPAILAQLRAQFHTNAAHNALLWRELRMLLSLFAAHGIPALPFKGPVLAVSVYGSLTLRQFRDLDILVHKANLERATALLRSQGYRLGRSLIPTQEARLLQSDHAETLIRADGLVAVDLHWALAQSFYSFPYDHAGLWARRVSVALAGATVNSFSPEDTLLYLCMHGAKHGWKRLAWICDLHELLRVSPGMDWKVVEEQAWRLRSGRVLFLGLSLAQRLLGTELPQDIMRRIQSDPRAMSLAVTVAQRLFREEKSPRAEYGRFAFLTRSSIRLKARERLRDQVPYLLHLTGQVIMHLFLPTAKDRTLLALPRRLAWLYGVLRPLRLAWQGSIMLVRRLRAGDSRFPAGGHGCVKPRRTDERKRGQEQ